MAILTIHRHFSQQGGGDLAELHAVTRLRQRYQQSPPQERPIEEVRVENANLDAIAKQYAGNEAAIEATGNYFTIYVP